MQPFVIEVTLVNEPLVRVRLKHILGFMYFIVVYSPTESSNRLAGPTVIWPQRKYMVSSYLYRTKIMILQSLVLHVLLYG